MAINDELNKLHNAKAKIVAQEKQLLAQRKAEVASLAESYGILALSDDEIRVAFENLVYHHARN